MQNDFRPGGPVGPPRPPMQPQPGPQPVSPQPTMPTQPPSQPVYSPQSPPAMQPPAPQPIDAPAPPTRRRRTGLWVTLAAIVLLLVAAPFAWYAVALDNYRLLGTTEGEEVRVEIPEGTTPSGIASLLRERGVIRSELAFSLHTRLEGVQNNLQAGVYVFASPTPVPEVAAQLVRGPSAAATFNITFVPGATLEANRKVLLDAGYSEAEVTAALEADYDHPLFQTRPETADLEGYIYGETHQFDAGTPAETVLKRFFDDYYAVIQKHDLVDAYAQQGMTLYEGITLASIIQRESGGDDKAQIAQVFLLRLELGMPLGSDVTYQYIADKLGVQRSTTLDNPYNTRVKTGLPPGPIAVPGVDALRAVAAPAEGDYLFFLSGDDDVTYYARTQAGHEANIRDHCAIKCQII